MLQLIQTEASIFRNPDLGKAQKIWPRWSWIVAS
jgi:hypothetical protein